MKISKIVSLATAVAGASAALRVLTRRHNWEQRNNKIAVCIDFDDVQAAAIRAGLPFAHLLEKLADNGATHLSLPEWTLDRLLAQGRLTPQAPATPLADAPEVGHWNYLHGDSNLVAYLAQELQVRLPFTKAAVLNGATLAFGGDLPTIGELGLGFDEETAVLIQQYNLSVVPRPVSYAWPQKELLERTLAQAAAIGKTVAFDGNMILGHEMHLDETVAALEETGLTFVYFSEARHQKGDWFIAKRRAPHVVLGHFFSPEDMVPLDFHAACHNWAHFAKERGIRFCYVNFFRILHATAPLEGIDYVHHLKHALEDAGYELSRDVTMPTPVPEPDTQELAMAGLAAAGIGATAVSDLLNLPEVIALPLTAVAAAGAMALPYLEQQRNEAAIARLADNHDHDHHHDHSHDHDHDHDHGHDHGDLHALYPPSYTPKLLGLGLATLSPMVGVNDLTFSGWLSSLVAQAVAAPALATVNSGQAYQLRIEEYRGFNLDWALPLTAVALRIPNQAARAVAFASIAGAWMAARKQDVDLLAVVDPDYAEGHTHHISAAMAKLGDIQMAIGAKPARKWAGLAPLAFAASGVLASNGRKNASAAASALGVVGSAFGLVGFRRPERALMDTAREAIPSLGVGTAVGLLIWLIGRK